MKTIQTKNSIQCITEKYENEFWNAMHLLNIETPDIISRVTDNVSEIIEYVSEIINNGYAYTDEESGSVYFAGKKFEEEGKLFRPNTVGDSNEMQQPDLDFVLWKGRNGFETGEESSVNNCPDSLYLSPWGQGRPGWHIECSTIAHKFFGDHIDIHFGGIDLFTIHHTNEINQSRAHYLHDNWCKTFVHFGHLNIKGRKMSKSLKNFISIEEILQKYSMNAIRILFLLHKYDATIDYHNRVLEEMKQLNLKFARFLSYLYSLIETSDCSLNDSLNDTLNNSLNNSLNDTLNNSLNDSMNDTLNNSLNDSMNDMLNDSLNDSMNDTLNNSLNDSMNDMLNNSLNDSMNDTLNNSLNDSMNDRLNNPSNDLTNDSSNDSHDDPFLNKLDKYKRLIHNELSQFNTHAVIKLVEVIINETYVEKASMSKKYIHALYIYLYDLFSVFGLLYENLFEKKMNETAVLNIIEEFYKVVGITDTNELVPNYTFHERVKHVVNLRNSLRKEAKSIQDKQEKKNRFTILDTLRVDLSKHDIIIDDDGETSSWRIKC
jgi:cysteinyl-tRNA synthetase